MDKLGDRMKGYENGAKNSLNLKAPVIARIDGKAFHTLTKGMNSPWDDDFITCMESAAKALCVEVQGTKIAYFQSDEISLYINDFANAERQAWFGYQINKLCSVTAAIASSAFLYEYLLRFPHRAEKIAKAEPEARFKLLPKFDARFFNIPENEIPAYFVWRQEDCIKNSKNALARKYYSHQQLFGVSSGNVIEMLKTEKNVDWHALDDKYKFGQIFIKEKFEKKSIIQEEEITAIRSKWQIPKTPIFSFNDSEFFSNLL